MKNQIFRAIAVFSMVFGLAGVSAHAQTPSTVEVAIPFEFSAGKATLKAGVYSVRRSSANLLVLRGSKGKSVILNAPLSVASKDKGERLVFRKYGEKYVLTQVWLTAETGRELISNESVHDEKAEQVQVVVGVK